MHGYCDDCFDSLMRTHIDGTPHVCAAVLQSTRYGCIRSPYRYRTFTILMLLVSPLFVLRLRPPTLYLPIDLWRRLQRFLAV